MSSDPNPVVQPRRERGHRPHAFTFSFNLFWLGLGLGLGLGGCATLNVPYSPDAAPYAFPDQPTSPNTRSLFVCLSFSGGGTRAAAFSYGVLEKLRDTEIVWKGETKRLLDEVDCISSVSGGSFTSAYYGLFGNGLFIDFEERFLEKNVQRALILRLLNPIHWLRLASPYFSRSDLAAEYYDKHLFGRRSFGALTNTAQPFLLINSTNMANGQQFSFTQEQFQYLASSLNDYPVARAVAASSAFPIGLTPITLRNYPNPPDLELPDLRGALGNYVDNRRSHVWAVARNEYATRKDDLPYLHLMDGGLADNIGLRAIMVEYRRGFIRRSMNRGEIEKLVVIVVNARTRGEDTTSESRRAPGLVAMAGATASVAMDNYSAETIAGMQDLMDERDKTRRMLAQCRAAESGCDVDLERRLSSEDLVPFVIDLGFEALPNRKERRKFLRMGTNFSLPKDQVEDLIRVGPRLMDASEAFQDLMVEIGVPTGPGGS